MAADGAQDWTVESAVRYGESVLTGRLTRLRGAREDDYERLAGWWTDMTLQATTEDAFYSRSAAAMIGYFREKTANSGPDVSLCVEAISSDFDAGELVGFVSLRKVQAKNRSAAFGIGLGPQHRGRGYGTDATSTIVQFGFREMNLHRIELETYAYNEPARRSYLKAGFSEEGRRRDAAFHDGRWHDTVLMSILSTDPRPGV